MKIKVFQKGQWVERTHEQAYAVPALTNSNSNTSLKHDNEHKAPRIFSGGVWHVADPNAARNGPCWGVEAEAAADYKPPTAYNNSNSSTKAAALDTVGSAIQTAMGGYLMGSLPGSPQRASSGGTSGFDSPQRNMAAALSGGAISLGTDLAVQSIQDTEKKGQIVIDAAKSIGDDFVSSFVGQALKNTASVLESASFSDVAAAAASTAPAPDSTDPTSHPDHPHHHMKHGWKSLRKNSMLKALEVIEKHYAFPVGMERSVRGIGLDSRVKHSNTRHTNANIKGAVSVPSTHTNPFAAAVSNAVHEGQEREGAVSNDGYKVFQRGHWVLLNHHKDATGSLTDEARVGASQLREKYAKNDSQSINDAANDAADGATGAGEDAGDVQSEVVVSVSTDQVPAPAVAAASRDLEINHLIPTDETIAATAAAAASAPNPEAAVEMFSQAELALQQEIERIRARLQGTPAMMESLNLSSEALALVRVSTDFTNATPTTAEGVPLTGRPRSPRQRQDIEVSAISGGHVVVPPPIAPLSLHARSHAREWGIYTDGYVNDSEGHYTRWADDMDYSNDYDCNNLDKVFAHAPPTARSGSKAAAAGVVQPTGHIIRSGAAEIPANASVFAPPLPTKAAVASDALVDSSVLEVLGGGPGGGDSAAPPVPAVGVENRVNGNNTTPRTTAVVTSMGASLVENMLEKVVVSAAQKSVTKEPSGLRGPGAGIEAVPNTTTTYQRPPERRNFPFAPVEIAAVQNRAQREKELQTAAAAQAQARGPGNKFKSAFTAEELTIQVKELKNRLACPVCNTRDKKVIITRCKHMFCRQCVNANLEGRNRKCPSCGIRFDKKDVEDVWF